MKILKRPKFAPTKFVCQACGCEYEAEYGEYYLFSDGIMRHYNGTTKQCKCPMCGSKNFLTEDFEEDK